MSRLGIKIMLIAGIAFFLATALTGFLGYFVLKEIFTDRIVNTDIVNLADKKSIEFEKIIGKAVQTSLSLADDETVLEWFKGGEKDTQLGLLSKIKLRYIAKQFNYPTVSAINLKTLHYWTKDGVLMSTFSRENPKNKWFFDVIDAGKKIKIELDYSIELKKTYFFFNALMGNPRDPIGVAGVGLALPEVLSHFVKHDFGELGQVWLINQDGEIKMSANEVEIGKNIQNHIPQKEVNRIFSRLQNKSNLTTNVLEYKDEEEGMISLAITKIKSTNLITVIKIKRDHWVEKTLRPFARGVFYSASVLLLTVIFLFAIYMLKTGRIFTRISQALLSLGEKNFTFLLPQKDLNQKNEMGDIARGYEKSRKSLADILSKLSGDIRLNIKNLSTSSTELNHSSKEMQITSDIIAKDIDESAEKIDETNQSIKKIAHSIHNIASQIKDIQESANLANSSATQGALALVKTKSTMEKIDDSSQKIEGIIKVITDIADQTNLLSLNATIEAAKAGEFGRGFSVVADEVRNLAEKSGVSVIEISELIEISSLNVKNGHAVNKDTALLFNRIIQQIQEINDNIKKVDQNIIEQDSGIQNVVKSTNKISNLIKNNASAVTEQAAASNEITKTINVLSQMAHSLEHSLGKFKF